MKGLSIDDHDMQLCELCNEQQQQARLNDKLKSKNLFERIADAFGFISDEIELNGERTH